MNTIFIRRSQLGVYCSGRGLLLWKSTYVKSSLGALEFGQILKEPCSEHFDSSGASLDDSYPWIVAHP